MNALCNLIAALIKWGLIGSVLIVGSFIAYIAQGQDRFKAENHARDVIKAEEELKARSRFEIVQLRYLSGDQQARYYLLGMVRAAREMMISYQDWCPPVWKDGEKSDPERVIQQIFDSVGNQGYGYQTEKVFVAAMLDINSCDYNDWPELIN